MLSVCSVSGINNEAARDRFRRYFEKGKLVCVRGRGVGDTATLGEALNWVFDRERAFAPSPCVCRRGRVGGSRGRDTKCGEEDERRTGCGT
jgi:hypothetical protein